MKASKRVSKIVALLLVGGMALPFSPAWGLRVQTGLESEVGSVLERRLASGLEGRSRANWKLAVKEWAVATALGAVLAIPMVGGFYAWRHFDRKDRAPDLPAAPTTSEAKEASSRDDSFTQYEDALHHYAAKIQSQGGQPALLIRSLLDEFQPTDPENALDFSSRQLRVVRESPLLKFGSGVLYHGRDGLDHALQEGFLTGEMFFTRVGHQWATVGFHPGAKDPAIFVMDAEVFNRYMERGEATLGVVGKKESGVIDPYPSIHVPAALSDFSEIWVSEDAFRRYKNIAAGKFRDPSEEAIQRNVRSLLEQGKLKAIMGLQDGQFRAEKTETELPYEIDPVEKTVGLYILSRDFLKEIPTFEARTIPEEGLLVKQKTVVSGTARLFTAKLPKVLHIAAHGHLLVPLQRNFESVSQVVWHEVPVDLDEAEKALRSFSEEQVNDRFVILDSLHIEKARVREMLPDQKIPVYLVDAVTAQRLTPASIEDLLFLQLPSNRVYILELRQDKPGETLLLLRAA